MPPSCTPRILIVDDHEAICMGLDSYLSMEGKYGPIDFVLNCRDALEKIEANPYDLIILDLSMPGTSSFELITNISKSKKDVKVIVYSGQPEAGLAERALRLGASGFISKGGPMEELRFAIDKVLAGERHISHRMAEKLALRSVGSGGDSSLGQLSDREFQVMRMMALGKANRDMAEELELSVKTIETYRQRMMEKMGFKSNAEVVSYAVSQGLI